MRLVDEFIASQEASDEFAACTAVVQRYFPSGLLSDSELYEFARSHGIEILKRDATPYEGMIERDSTGKATIVLRKGMNRRRERFTLAHELGHWLLQDQMLGTMEGQLFRGLSANPFQLREEERLASLLAAEILMPCGPLLRAFDTNDKLRSLHRVCRVFGVSRTAAVRRIADVCNQNVLLLQIVPYRFKQLESIAEIDDAIFASARKSTLFNREGTKLLDKHRFSDLIASHMHALRVSTPKGRLDELFEVDFRPTPIPHAFALTWGQLWD